MSRDSYQCQLLSTSPLHHTLQHRKELRKRDSGRLSTVDRTFTFGAQRGHGKRHRDAMVSAGINLSAMQLLISRNAQAIFPLLALGTHGPQVSCDESDAVG